MDNYCTDLEKVLGKTWTLVGIGVRRVASTMSRSIRRPRLKKEKKMITALMRIKEHFCQIFSDQEYGSPWDSIGIFNFLCRKHSHRFVCIDLGKSAPAD